MANCLFTWPDGVKVADRRDPTRNLSLQKRCTDHLHHGTAYHQAISVQTLNKNGLERKQNTRRHGNNVSHDQKKLLNDRDEKKNKTRQN